MNHELFELSSGRKLEILTTDVVGEAAIVFHHGTPGSIYTWETWIKKLNSLGLSGIAYSRPGYGRSERSQGRSVSSVGRDIDEVLTEFGVKRFVSIGHSGGGPHALGDSQNSKCLGVLTIAGVGPYGDDELNFLEGMAQENHDEFGAALEGVEALTAWMDKYASGMASVTGKDVIESFGGLISDADKAVLTDAYAEEAAKAMAYGLSVSYFGWFDDDLAFVKDWGFKLSDVKVPVELWQGDQDLMVPHAHAYFLEKHLPNVQLKFQPGEGHMSLPVNCESDMIANAQALLNS
ncbi:MAG: alpha/beta fold hydrolase [Actinomycetota bacterium]